MSDEFSKKELPLNPHRKIFIAEYLIDFNATQAAIRAGYKIRSAYATGHALLKQPNVARAIREAIKERAERLGFTADDIILRLIKVYERSMQAEPVMAWNPSTKRMESTGEYVFDSKGANKALELIGKHLGMFKTGDGVDNRAPFIIQINEAPKGRAVTVIPPRPDPGPALPGLPVISTEAQNHD